MKRAIGYVRVSTGQQADEGQSLETQRARITAHAVAAGLHLVGIIEETGSGASVDERPMLAHALATLRKDADVLVVVKLDRLTRSVVDLHRLLAGPLEKRGLVSLTESIDTASASGRMMMSLITVFSEWEREAIGERTRVVLRHKQAQGERVSGHAPFGWRFEGARVVEEPAEQRVIERVRQLRADRWKWREIVDVLEGEGHRPRAAAAAFFKTAARDGGGLRFAPASLRRMLARAPIRRTETGEPPSVAATSA